MRSVSAVLPALAVLVLAGCGQAPQGDAPTRGAAWGADLVPTATPIVSGGAPGILASVRTADVLSEGTADDVLLRFVNTGGDAVRLRVRVRLPADLAVLPGSTRTAVTARSKSEAVRWSAKPDGVTRRTVDLGDVPAGRTLQLQVAVRPAGAGCGAHDARITVVSVEDGSRRTTTATSTIRRSCP